MRPFRGQHVHEGQRCVPHWDEMNSSEMCKVGLTCQDFPGKLLTRCYSVYSNVYSIRGRISRGASKMAQTWQL